MFVVTAATGKLGGYAVEALLTKVPRDQVAVAVRAPDKAKALAARGVEVRKADYADASSLRSAFREGDKILFISSSEAGRRLEQHRAVIDAAKRARAALLVYTSILHCESCTLMLAAEHKATEAAILSSGIPFALLRNGWYLENYTEHLGAALEHGAILGSAKNGRIAAASRADYADAAVAVLTEGRLANATYELAGDARFTKRDLAAEVGRQSEIPVVYRDLPLEEYKSALVQAGLRSLYAEILADSDLGIARGELDDTSGTLRRLIDRPTTTLPAAISAGLESIGRRS